MEKEETNKSNNDNSINSSSPQVPPPNMHAQIMADLTKELKEIRNKSGQNSTSISDKAIGLFTLIKLFSTMKILKEDFKPVMITDGLFIGSIGAASNYEAMKEAGITHVVCAANGIKEYYKDNFKYLSLDILDSEKEQISKFFDKAADFINEAIINGGKVLVHCHAGISRSSSICMSYLMKYRKLKFIDALNLMQSKRKQVNPNNGFRNQLREYEKKLGL